MMVHAQIKSLRLRLRRRVRGWRYRFKVAGAANNNGRGRQAAAGEVGSPILDWEEGDRFSFEDSDRFEEDSLCSWSSEPESLLNNWRGWKRPNFQSSFPRERTSRRHVPDKPTLTSLTELAAKCVASHIPFELVENVYPPVPEQLQLRIAFWSFPDSEDDIRLYSCLANGSADEFQRGEHLFRDRTVKDPLQIGFHLSATVAVSIPRSHFNVAVTFDRRRISSCNCTCPSMAYWCSHIVAVCLHRIHSPMQVCLRAPVSESLQRLRRDQLQKFAQYLISELPRQILPTAQRLLDELLSSQPTAINTLCGAPDPTAGASAYDHTSWYLDEKTLHNNINKILVKFCVPAPIVFSDVNYLSTTAPPAAAEWASLLRPLRGREPEGMWNLLSIVREMYKRNDRNAIPLLGILTEELMACEQILVWWYSTKAALVCWSGGGGGGKHGGGGSTHASQHACASLCDEVVVLWRLAALNPALAPHERDTLHEQFGQWHTKVLEKVAKSRSSHMNSQSSSGHGRHGDHGRHGHGHGSSRNQGPYINGITENEVFPGFQHAMEACFLEWEEYPIPDVTYTRDVNPLYHSPFTIFKETKNENIHQVNSSKAVINNEMSLAYRLSKSGHMKGKGLHNYRHNHRYKRHDSTPGPEQAYPLPIHVPANVDGNRSSVSSEGFCENEEDLLPALPPALPPQPSARPDSDSQDASDSTSTSSSTAGTESRPHVLVTGFANRHMRHYTHHTHTHAHPHKEQPHNSKDDSVSGSDSQHSSDELFYPSFPTSGPIASTNQSDGTSQSEAAANTGGDLKWEVNALDTENISENSSDQVLPSCEGVWEVLFARAEGLHAHGHTKDACQLGVRLARDLLLRPPVLLPDTLVASEATAAALRKGKRKYMMGAPYHHRVNAQSHRLTCLASATLAKCAFLCTVLAENPAHHELAFRVGLFALELARPPASTKPLEVKLVNQESELVALLKKLPVGPEQRALTRAKAEMLKDGTLRSRGPALLPIALANFIFDVIVLSPPDKVIRMESDELLGFEAAVVALGLKANVAEADHPLLCEGTRRQRSELALTLLSHYRDDPVRMARIMNKLLDREIHQLTKSPMMSMYYTCNQRERAQSVRQGGGSSGGGGEADRCSALAEMERLLLGDHSATVPAPPAALSAAQGQAHNTSQRNKDLWYKGKRLYPSVPNQPSEASAHFMFELAKAVLAKAGGSSSTSLFTQTSAAREHHGPHRGLHMAAFQLGLYALGLHNCVSANWLSRTYSSHVSWITGQAMDIGAPAILFLIDAWEGHLTPPEAASIADKASTGRDVHTVRAASELALSVLPHAHALSYAEIQRAVLQCKEQSDAMLERACLTVESAAKGGGVYPEVLYTLARYWHELFMRYGPCGAGVAVEEETEIDCGVGAGAASSPPIEETLPALPSVSSVAAVAMPTMPPVPYAVAPYGFTYHPQHLSFTATPLYQFPYSSPPPQYAVPQYFVTRSLPIAGVGVGVGPQQQLMLGSAHPTHPHLPPTHLPPPPLGTPLALRLVAAEPDCSPRHDPSPSPATAAHHTGMGSALHSDSPTSNQGVQRGPQQTQLRRLLAAYRVGMLALETQARRVHDDRPHNKFGRNPPYGENVKWLLRIAKKLGTQYLQQFCVCAVNSVVSPFVLYELAVEAAAHLARAGLGLPPQPPHPHQQLVMQHLRGALAPLVQKCQQMYIQCIHQKLYHLTSLEHEEFVSTLLAARTAFQLTPEGHSQFKEWLQSLRRSKSCKKELWAQINTALQSSGK